MKHLLFILSVVFLFIGCNGNNPEKQEPNQPKRPSLWSPEGHVYTCIRDNRTDVIQFTDYDSYVLYGTTNDDILSTDGINADEGLYEINYPNVTIGVSGRNIKAVFKDTLTLQLLESDYVMYR